MAKEQKDTTSESVERIVLTPDELKAIVAQQVAEALKGALIQPATGLNSAEIGKAIADGIAANSPRRKVTIGEYLQRPHSSTHPEGDGLQKTFKKRQYFQNGVPLQFSTTWDQEIQLLDQITHSGRYIDRLVEVIVGRDEDSGDEVVHVRWNNKRDKALELKQRAKDFPEILRQILAAQKEERADQEAEAELRKESRRKFGSSRATQEAIAAAKG